MQKNTAQIRVHKRRSIHPPLTNIQKCLQRIFATLYFVRSFFDDLFLQRFILSAVFLTIYFCNGLFCSVFSYPKINSQKKSAQKIFAYLFLH